MSTYLRSLALLALTVCGFAIPQQASAEIKIGFVNFNKLMEDAPQTKSAMAALENEFGPRRRELLTMQNDLKSRDDKFQKEQGLMAEADRSKTEKALRDGQREFTRKAGEFQDDATQRKNEELGKVQRYLVGEIQSYAQAQGYDLVVAEAIFAKPVLDITPQVLAVLATKPANVGAPAAAPAPAKTPAPAAKPAGGK